MRGKKLPKEFNLDTIDYQFISKPHRSLCAQSRLVLLIILSIIPILIAVGFVIVGLWPVFPFVGLELFALSFAFYCINCHDNDYESITILKDKVLIEKRNHKLTSQFEFNAYWLQVKIIRAKNGCLRLSLRSQGKEIQFGKHMDSQACNELAEHLKKFLHLLPQVTNNKT